MACRFPSENKVQLRARKGHDMTWSCDKHAEPIAFYCKEHRIPICHRCATKDHGQKPCELEDIEDVILEMRRKIEDTETKIAAAKECLEMLGSKLESTETSATNHLQPGNIGKLQSVKDKERDEIRLINEQADKEIRIINEKRERRIKACKEEAEKQQRAIKESEGKLISDMQAVNEKVKKKIDELKNKNRYNIDLVGNMDSKIERIKRDDKTLVNEAPQVIASVDLSLISNFHREVTNHLDQIQSEFQRIKFVERKVVGEHNPIIDDYIDKWEPLKSLDIPLIVNKPLVHGLISDDEICVLDDIDKALYVTNIRSERTKKVMKGDRKVCVTSCAPVDINVIACGKWRRDCKGDSLDGCITLYDRQWKVIRDISIPRNTSPPYNTVYVAVDKDGMILAAQYGQSNIYVINPVDCKIIRTITMQGNVVLEKIQCLSSDDIVVKTSLEEFTVISRSTENKTVIHCDDWDLSCCAVDKLTDTLYITYSDQERNIYAVDQVSRDGNTKARRIVTYPKSVHYFGQCLVTPSGNLVVCNGSKLFVYKKK